MDSEKVEQDRRDTSSTFISEIASIKKDALESYSAATKIYVETEDAQPSVDETHNNLPCQELQDVSKLLFQFASLEKLSSSTSK